MNIVDTKLERCWFNNLDEGDVFLYECTYYIKQMKSFLEAKEHITQRGYMTD